MIWLAGVWGCEPVSQKINVVPHWLGKPISCNQSLGQTDWHLGQLQFYLSHFKLDNTSLALATSPYQNQGVVLLGSDCTQSGNWTLEFDGALSQGLLSFELGVPFALNHQNPIKALSPLNQSDMFWTWQLGYKFLRLDLTRLPTAEHSATGWSFHLGSHGCQSPSPMRSPQDECRNPNRFLFSLPYRGETELVLELSQLLGDEHTIKTSLQESCMSEPDKMACQPLFSRLQNASQAADTRLLWQWLRLEEQSED